MSAVHNTEAWHAARAQAVGGSEVAALFGVQPAYALSHYALWHVKAGYVPAPPVDNDRVKWGLRLEEPIARGIAEDNGWTIQRGGHVIDPTTPGMACTLDFIARDPARSDPGALEIKNVDAIQHARTWTDGEPPLHILLQLQHQLACTGYAWGAIGGLAGGNTPHVYRYEAKPGLIAQIRDRVTAFWQSIADGKPPPVDGSDGAAAVLRALYPEVYDELIDLRQDNELPSICAGYLQAVADRKAADKAEAEWKARLVEKVGPHARIQAAGFWINVPVTPEKPSRIAEPGEVISGRKETRRYTVKEMQS